MYDFFFILFGILTLGSALLVTLSRNAVNAAMFMIVSLVSLAALFLLLDAFFLAILQVLVYAGAVMVLFLFVIMLMNVEQGAKKRFNWIVVASAVVGLALLACGVFYLFGGSGETATTLAATPLPAITELPVDATIESVPYTSSSRSFGYLLFTKYMLPFQVTGFLLLIAMVGVIVISKKINARGEEPEDAR